MSTFHEFVAETLSDKRIDDQEVALIRDRLCQDGWLDLDDVKLLVEFYCSARDRSPAFEDLFFQVLEKVFLADGEIGPSEQFYLLKMLYSDREIHQREREFLLKLRRGVSRVTPEFDALCKEALQAHPTDWDVGGR